MERLKIDYIHYLSAFTLKCIVYFIVASFQKSKYHTSYLSLTLHCRSSIRCKAAGFVVSFGGYQSARFCFSAFSSVECMPWSLWYLWPVSPDNPYPKFPLIWKTIFSSLFYSFLLLVSSSFFPHTLIHLLSTV